MNAELEARVASLEGLLSATLGRDDYLDFEDLKESFDPAEFPFEPGYLGRSAPRPVLTEPKLRTVARPGFFSRTFAGGVEKYEAALASAEAEHQEAVAKAREELQAALADYARRDAERKAKLATALAEHEQTLRDLEAAVEQQRADIDALRSAFDANEPSAVAEYFSRVLERSPYPEGLPKQARVAFVPESRQLVVERDLPTADVVPRVKGYRYVKSRDEVSETARPSTQVRSLYASVVAQVALRTVHELFEADRGRKLETIVVSCFVDTVDPGTGKPVRPCLVTLRCTREEFEQLDLGKVDPAACLKALKASVSRSPTELLPVRPVVDFSMVDPRFIEETDVLSGLDQRPNLMELTPSEFENLITNLFGKMGLETRQTQASRDGGVDCVAWDNRPILGGKVVIQAKRYKNTVGVSAVRDLFGTMQNEGASKGILVTTSGYGSASFEFADGKPIELLSGRELLYLLAENAGIEARIEPPEDWVDPSPEMDEPPTN